MVKDGEDWHGLQTTNLKSFVKLFKPFNRDSASLILKKFARPIYFFFLIRFSTLTELNIVRRKCQWFCILVCNFFTAKHYRCRWCRWENLDCGQYPFQPIKFVNLVVPVLVRQSHIISHLIKTHFPLKGSLVNKSDENIIMTKRNIQPIDNQCPVEQG